MYNVKVLKQKGNDAFKIGQLDEALKFCMEAIELQELTDITLSAVLFSNRSQVYLMEKR
jgi:hypothetical protein